MGCVSSMEKARSMRDEFPQPEPTQKRKPITYQQLEPVSYEGMEDCQIESKIFKKSSIKKVKSDPVSAEATFPYNLPPRRSHSDIVAKPKVKTTEEEMISKEINVSNSSTLESGDNRHYEQGMVNINKQNVQVIYKQPEIKFSSSASPHYYSQKLQYDGIRKRVSLYQKETPLPIVEELSQEQIESAILRSAVKSSKSYDYPLHRLDNKDFLVPPQNKLQSSRKFILQ